MQNIYQNVYAIACVSFTTVKFLFMESVYHGYHSLVFLLNIWRKEQKQCISSPLKQANLSIGDIFN